MTTLAVDIIQTTATVTFHPGKAGIPVLDLPQLEELNQQLDQIESLPQVERILFVSEGSRFFLTGPPPVRFRDLETPAAAAHYSEVGQRTLDRIARSERITVAAISGTCLAGGLELALACDQRVVSESSELRLGFSSGLIGLLPAWGGTLRLPRLVGPSLALELISRSTAVGAQRAHAWGLIDKIAPAGELLEIARTIIPQPRRARLLDRLVRNWGPLRTLVFRRAENAARVLAPDESHHPAPRRLARLTELALSWRGEDQLLQEQRAFVEAAGSPAAREMREALISPGT